MNPEWIRVKQKLRENHGGGSFIHRRPRDVGKLVVDLIVKDRHHNERGATKDSDSIGRRRRLLRNGSMGAMKLAPETKIPYSIAASMGRTCRARSARGRVLRSSNRMALSTVNLPDCVRRSDARWPPQPSFSPTSWQSVRT